ncbi:YbaK/EbsC family protein [Methylobrevis pamukkalensis]|uniref:YbaK / prolyl-tRNA synthetases associated domain protein n=1 Tax=Methylobrevis pamukkalensis TaxID=1439726 RepID=A0A1E3H1P4_9HYPH|nr:YbaK/EbsC family protein [Methylobrevis pamukkalensis]ODN70249.1 YbaK / prolyl-tRNA synthetases associated domain protein [Methylobrevis pamukkalensis]
MTTPLPDAARRVAAAAQALGLDVAVIEMPASTRTAEDAAAACGCTVGQIVKSLVFSGRDSGTPYLLLVSGTNRVDQEAVAAHLGEPLDRPNGKAVRDITGFAIGGIPPLGHATPLATFFDPDLLAHDIVWAAAGTPSCVFSVAPGALAAAIGAKTLVMTG